MSDTAGPTDIDLHTRTAPLPSGRVAGAAMAGVVVLFGFGPVITKLITAPPFLGAALRFWVTLPLIWGIAVATGRRVDRQVLRQTALPGAMFGFNLALVFAALQHASIAVFAVTAALQPGIVILVAGRWLGERATSWHVIWTVVGIVGVIVVVLGGDPDVHSDAFGIVLAVAANLSFVFYYVMNRRLRSTTDMDAVSWMVGITLFAGLAITPVALATTSLREFNDLDGRDWLLISVLACSSGVVGHTLMSWVHKFIAASQSSLYILGMNVVSVAAAWPIHDEPVTVIQAVGGAIVLGAVAAVVMRPASVRVELDALSADIAATTGYPVKATDAGRGPSARPPEPSA